MGIVLPKKFPLWCHWMTQRPESPGGWGSGRNGVGGGGKKRRNQEGASIPAQPSPPTPTARWARAGSSPALPGLSFPQSERCWALSGSQCGPSLRIPGSRAPPGAVDSEAGRGAWESEFSGAPPGDSAAHLLCGGVWEPGSPRLLACGPQRGCSALLGRLHSQREHFSC